MRYLLTIALIVAASTSAVLADDLPGVKPSDTIVQPLPEPIDDKPDAQDGAIKVGDWDVKVSGSIIVDVGVGNIKPPRR
jgi:hypothetical protein